LQSDWEASSDEEKKKPASGAVPVAPAKKKGTFKQKLAEKEAARQAKLAAGNNGDVDYDEDAVLDPRDKARLEKERELEADLHHAKELFGSASIKGTCAMPPLSFSPLFFKPSVPLCACPALYIYMDCRLVGRGPRPNLKIDAQN
jgi:hypothetical protein